MATRDILSPELTPWVVGAAGVVMLGALGLAMRIGIARDPRPEIALERAIEIICGSARWTGEQPTATVDHMTDVIEALVQDAATERISMWGANVPIPAFGAIRSALTKIPASYWRDHQVDLLAFYENRAGRTCPLLVGLSDRVSPDSYSDLCFDRSEIERFKRSSIVARPRTACP
jgi:hypothetical protein